jgi:hypothetical protein
MSAGADAEVKPAAASIYFHEDRYCQTQLLPLSAWAFCAEQLGGIERFANDHRDRQGGYTDIYVRKDGPVTLADLRLRHADLDRVLAAHLTCHRSVTTGYSSHEELAPRTVAYGQTQLGCVFVQFDETGLVSQVFMQLLSMQPREIDQMHAALGDLAGITDLLLVDWEHHQLLALADGGALRKYLSHSLAVEGR